MKRIVTYTHRYKRPPRKKRPAVPLAGARIVAIRHVPHHPM